MAIDANNVASEALQIVQRSLYCKDLELYRHSLLTADIARHVAQNVSVDFGFTPEQAYIAGILHDVGKLCISSEILEKKESLAPREWEVIKRHPVWGYEYVQGTVFEEYGEIILCHHEKNDGTGYPLLAKSEDLSNGVRLVSLADQLAAFLDNRPYRRRITHFGLVCRETRLIASSLFTGNALKDVVAALQEFTVGWINKTRGEQHAFTVPEALPVECRDSGSITGCGYGSCQKSGQNNLTATQGIAVSGLVANA